MKYLKHIIVFGFALAALGYFAFSERGLQRVHAKFLGGPPLLMTGAPGEGTCVGCHYTYGDTNVGAGHVRITGLPAVYTPGQTYNLTVTVSDPQARSWGFEVTATDAYGRSFTNAQATTATVGTLTVSNNTTMTKRTAAVNGQTRVYVSHLNIEGIYQGRANSASWAFTWTAPSANAGDVTFYASGNAANNQVSPEGDYIYTTLALVKAPSTELLTGLSTYSTPSGSSQLDLTVNGTFDAGSKIVFYGTELMTQVVPGGLAASIPAGLLTEAGAFPVSVKLPNGAMTNTRFLVVSSAVNPHVATTTEAATYSLNVAPGEIATIFGTRLNGVANATSSGFAPAIPLPRTMQNTTVYVNGVPAPLFFTYAFGTQINYQIPYGTKPGTASVVVLRSDGEISRGTVNVVAASPGLFTLSNQGTGQAIAQNAVDNSLNGDPATVPNAKRVKKGEYLVFYGTGAGAQLVDFNTGQSVSVADGVASGANPIIATATTPTVTVGGKAANVAFSGLSPSFVGVWQLNVQVPADAPSGASVDVVITYGGATAKTLTVAVE